jgi:hypothetical protein
MVSSFETKVTSSHEGDKERREDPESAMDVEQSKERSAPCVKGERQNRQNHRRRRVDVQRYE